MEITREELAYQLFLVMNSHHEVWKVYGTMEERWTWYKSMGFDKGYLALADHVLTKGYKP